MRGSKFVGVLVICVCVSSLLFAFYRENTFGSRVPVEGGSGVVVEDKKLADVSELTQDKLPALLSDVIGLDLSKYTIKDAHGATHDPYGGSVMVENYVFYLVDKKGGVVSVNSEFRNGFPDWVLISPSTGSLYYAIDPPDGSVEQLKNVFERYVAFAKKYDVDTVDVSLALDLFDRAPNSLPKNELSPAKVTSEDLSLYISQQSFGFGSIVNGFEIPNKFLGIAFNADCIQFSDSFKLYSVYTSFFSEKELTDFAFEAAKKYCDSSFTGDGVKPVLTKAGADVSLVFISGQLHNNDLNNALLEEGVGTSYSVKRDALTLYPYLSATFYLNTHVGNIDGVQISVWGDTNEVASCYEHTFRVGSW